MHEFWKQQIEKWRLNGTKVSWEKAWKFFGQKLSKPFETKSKKSILYTFDVCVVSEVHDLVIDIRRATEGRYNFETSPLHKGIFKKKVLHKKHSEKNTNESKKLLQAKYSNHDERKVLGNSK